MPSAACAGAGGSDGDGIGGGLYISTGGVVTLKKTTVALNFASTSNDNIYGTVDLTRVVSAGQWNRRDPARRVGRAFSPDWLHGQL